MTAITTISTKILTKPKSPTKKMTKIKQKTTDTFCIKLLNLRYLN
jgi:hypothetical protein